MVAPGLGAAGSTGTVRAVPVALGEAEFGAFYHAHVDKLFAFLSRRTDRDVGKELADLVFEQFFVWWQQHPDQAEPVGMLFRLARCRLYRSEEHTSELQSREKLVCRLLLEK